MMKANLSTVLTILGAIGIGVTVGLSINATSHAVKHIDREYDKLPDEVKDKKDDFTLLEKFKLTYKYYIPTMAVGAATITMFIVGNRIVVKQLKSVAALYSMTEAGAVAYQQKVLEQFGKKKAEAVEGAVAKDEMDRNPETISNRVGHSVCGENETRFYDRLSGRYFYSTMERVKDAVNRANAELLDQDFISLNHLYDELHLPRVEIGDELGWNTNCGRRESLIEMVYTPEFDRDGNVCTAFTSRIRPRYDFTKLM